jgi:hypothetical protein
MEAGCEDLYLFVYMFYLTKLSVARIMRRRIAE